MILTVYDLKNSLSRLCQTNRRLENLVSVIARSARRLRCALSSSSSLLLRLYATVYPPTQMRSRPFPMLLRFPASTTQVTSLRQQARISTTTSVSASEERTYFAARSDSSSFALSPVESESSNPAADPLLVWMNGGPGCSSLDGFLYEHGPFRVQTRSVLTPDGGEETEAYLEYFEQSWSKLSNTLYIEAPVGVGFSYSTAGAADYNCTDDTTAMDNLAALHSFYEKFPSFKDNSLYITGESYAGVYVPTLAEAVLQDATFPATLSGIAVGNGCSGSEVGICGWSDQGSALEAQYLTSSGFLPQSLKASIDANCDYGSWFAGDGVSDDCRTDIEELNTFTSDLDAYCVYCDCPASNESPHSKVHGVGHVLKRKVRGVCLPRRSPCQLSLTMHASLAGRPAGKGPQRRDQGLHQHFGGLPLPQPPRRPIRPPRHPRWRH